MDYFTTGPVRLPQPHRLAHNAPCLCPSLKFPWISLVGQVVYMDTEGNFRPERVEAIAERFGLDPTETLENVIVTRVFNHEQQIERAHVRGRFRLYARSFTVFRLHGLQGQPSETRRVHVFTGILWEGPCCLRRASTEKPGACSIVA